MLLRVRSWFLDGGVPIQPHHQAVSKRAVLVAVLASLFGAAADGAADVSVRVVGTVISGGGILAFEDPAEVTYTVRPGHVAPDANGATNIGDYLDATQPFTAIFGSGVFTVTCSGTRTFVNDDVAGPVPLPFNDRLTFRGEGCVDSFGGMLADTAFNVRVADTTATSITGDDLNDDVVLSLVDAANSGLFQLSCGNDSCDPSYAIGVAITGVSIVPEPGAASSAGCVLGAFAALARSRRARTRRISALRDDSGAVGSNGAQPVE
jgi:hypothetical protein